MYHTHPTLHDRTAPHTVPPPRRTTAGLLVSMAPLAVAALAVALAAAPLTTALAVTLSTAAVALAVGLRRRRSAGARPTPGRAL